jgi:hypothetical protein
MKYYKQAISHSNENAIMFPGNVCVSEILGNPIQVILINRQVSLSELAQKGAKKVK